MTTQQAIEILRLHNEWRRGADTEMTDPFELGQAIDTVVEVLSKPQWVGVEDRLPEIGTTSVYGSDWVNAFDGENIYMAKFIKLTTSQFWKEAYTEIPLSITHWMPLPETPDC